MNCAKTRDELSLYLYGELGFHEEEELERHLESCEECRAALEREKALQAAMDLSDEPAPPALLGACRRQLRNRLRSEAEARAGNAGLLEGLRKLLRSRWMQPAGAVALVAIGFFAARLTAPAPAASPDVLATRVRYVEPDQNGVRITLEETRERIVTGSLADEGVRGLLLAAAQDPADPALRVESIELLKDRSEALEVRSALMRAVVSDPNPGVRMKALEGLRRVAGDGEVRQALAQVLLGDDNAGLRAQAVDLLIQNRQKDVVGVLQELMQYEDNDYIRQRCQRALMEMNASLETF